MDFSFLDYIWRGLFVGTLSSLIVVSTLFLTSWIINKKATRQQMKYFFHIQILLTALMFVFSFVWVVCVDPELASGCFSAFAKDKSFFTVTRMLAVCWLGGFAFLAGLDIFRICRSYEISWNTNKDSTVDKILEQLMMKFNIKSRVVLCFAENHSSPFVEGLFSHRIVLPMALVKMNSQSLEHILAHELVHVRDRDAMWKILELWTRRILFFNPLMYPLAQKHLLAIEMAADEEAVLQIQVTAKDYVDTLIEVVSLHRICNTNPLVLNASRTFRETKERMEALLANSNQRPKTSFVNSMILVSILISVGFSVAQARSAVQESVQKNLDKGLMCSQIHHEKLMESWLRIEPEINKCEE